MGNRDDGIICERAPESDFREGRGYISWENPDIRIIQNIGAISPEIGGVSHWGIVEVFSSHRKPIFRIGWKNSL